MNSGLYIPIAELNNYIKKTELDKYIPKTDLDKYISKDEIKSNYVSKALYLKENIELRKLKNYIYAIPTPFKEKEINMRYIPDWESKKLGVSIRGLLYSKIGSKDAKIEFEMKVPNSSTSHIILSESDYKNFKQNFMKNNRNFVIKIKDFSQEKFIISEVD